MFLGDHLGNPEFCSVWTKFMDVLTTNGGKCRAFLLILNNGYNKSTIFWLWWFYSAFNIEFSFVKLKNFFTSIPNINFLHACT